MAQTSNDPAPDAVPASDISASVLLIRTDEIDMGERLRPVDESWAEALGQIMLRDGQMTPVEVCRLPGQSRWRLVAGGHRLAGALSADIAYLRAIEVSNDKAERRLREVSENLWRSALAPLDRAAFVAEMVTLQKVRAGIDPAKDGRAASIAARWQQQIKEDAADTSDTMSLVYGWSDAVADGLGVSKRTVERDMLLYRRVKPSSIERLRAVNHPVLNNAGQLAALAKLGEVQQSLVLDLLIEGKARSVAEALAVMSQKPQPSADQKRFRTVVSTIARMSQGERRGLIQSEAFQLLLPKEARDLLAPLLRDGGV